MNIYVAALEQDIFECEKAVSICDVVIPKSSYTKSKKQLAQRSSPRVWIN